MLKFSPTILVHLAGLAAISQVVFHDRATLFGDFAVLNKNTSEIMGTSVSKAIDSIHFLLPFLQDISLGELLIIVVYSSATIYFLYIVRKLYNAWCGEFGLYCPNVNTGFDFPEKELSKGLLSKQEVVNEVRRRKRVGEMPPPYPNGWFSLMRSKDLKKGCTISVNALGQNFAIFRDEEGHAHVLDAYCSHLGANLGVGGKVHGKCIECPFHGWQFDGETGKCTKIPYSKGKIPDKSSVKAWPTLEANGHLLVWYDAEGREPFWTTEDRPDIKSGKMVYRGYSEHFMNAHIEDIPENGADVSHLNFLHNAGVSSGSGLNYRDLLSGKLHTHWWTAEWKAFPAPDSHIGQMTLTMTNVILGLKAKFLDIKSVADQIGPGLVNLTLTSRFGTVMFLHSLTPQEPLLQKYVLLAYSDWWIPSFFVKWMVQGYDIQLERDMIVWNNKRYRLQPVFVREDELILKHRRWYSQFYSENSKRFTFQKDSTDF